MERSINGAYQQLVRTFQPYVDIRRKGSAEWALTSAAEWKLTTAARAFNEVFNDVLPALAAQPGFLDAYPFLPDHHYTDGVARFALDGLKITHPALGVIWDEYIVGGVGAQDVARQTSYSSRSVLFLAEKLPILIVDQLWDKNRELVGPAYPTLAPTTIVQRRIALLTAQWGIRGRPAEFLVASCHPGPRRGMKQICEELNLSPTGGGRTYQKLVRKLMGAPTWQAAVEMAMDLFRQHPETAWDADGQPRWDGKGGE